MDLTPGEKAVLGQIRVLYAEGAREGLLARSSGNGRPRITRPTAIPTRGSLRSASLSSRMRRPSGSRRWDKSARHRSGALTGGASAQD